jgi:predicted phosphate transport protein (TIGR00153 family)
MAILTNLFGESPFGALEAHGQKVHESVRLLNDVFAALRAGDQPRLRQIADRISGLETEADKIRNHIHEMLASATMFAMRREELFDILEQQDSMADRAEDIGFIFTYRDMTLPAREMDLVIAYVVKVLKCCELAAGIMSRLDLLVESSFKGRDALSVLKLVTELAEREDDLKPEQFELTRKLLAAEVQLPPVEAMLWVKVIALLAELAKAADRTGNGLRMSLQVKQSK